MENIVSVVQQFPDFDNNSVSMGGSDSTQTNHNPVVYRTGDIYYSENLTPQYSCKYNRNYPEAIRGSQL